MVSRRWLDTLVSVEESDTQVKVVFESILEAEACSTCSPTNASTSPSVDDPARPILLAVSDNGPPRAAADTRTFMTLMAIAQHCGRPHTSPDQAWIETFGHIKGEWPHVETIAGPALLETELARIRIEYDSVRLHEGVGYVTPDDEHYGRGERIREARRQGLARARQKRLNHHRRHHDQHADETP